MVEPRATEHELAQPVDERLAAHGGDAVPLAHDVPAERAPCRLDTAVCSKLDKVGDLFAGELTDLDESEPDGCGVDALFEVSCVEAEAVAEEVDRVVASGVVVGLAHYPQDTGVGGPRCDRRLSSSGEVRRVRRTVIEGTWTLGECPRDQVEELAAELGVSAATASVLVRRGLSVPESARRFLEPDEIHHDPFLLGDVKDACELISSAVDRGAPICVYGDYDVDGICAAAVAVTVLRAVGADVRWHLPSRFVEGYGLHGDTLEQLAEAGVELVLAVDCGITAVDEIAQARARGLDVIVCDHHRPGDALPDCPLVATRPSEYPFPELCGTGVVYKLMKAFAPGEPLHELQELVAMATIADVVPLLDENRALVKAGLRRLARTSRPGLSALMRMARVDPAGVDEVAVAFRLAPRLNAAGRLGHPESALRLLLAETAEEAAPLASELERLNRERQTVEERILRDALRQVDEWTPAQRARHAYVLAGEDWHQGVIGIVASRLVERFHRPVVLVAGGEEVWQGSGRSIPAFDLHASLQACAEHLERFGGHRAAAGLTIEPGKVESFAQALAEHAAGAVSGHELRPLAAVDAIVHGDELTLDLCNELQRLAPFGLGNPEVVLLAASCELADLTPVGNSKHLRMSVISERGRSGAIAFGYGPPLDRFRSGGRWDVAFRLSANRWNGTVTPQLVIKRLFESAAGYEELRRRLGEEWRAGPERWSDEARAVFTDLDLVGELAAGERRHLLESAAFRELLATVETPLAEAA